MLTESLTRNKLFLSEVSTETLKNLSLNKKIDQFQSNNLSVLHIQQKIPLSS